MSKGSMAKDIMVLGGGALLGNWLFERFIVKESADDPTGFVLAANGLGADDIARALSVAVGIMAVQWVL